MIRYAILRALMVLTRWVPPIAAYRLAALIGLLAYFLWPRGRRHTQETAALILGAGASRDQVTRLARQTMVNFAKYVVDFLRLPHLKPGELERRLRFYGWDHLEDALREGRGALLVGLHMGNWDLGGAAVAQRYPVHVVAESFSPPLLNRLIQGLRASWGMHVIPLETAAKGVLQALHRNEMLALLLDTPNAKNGVPVQFLGRTIIVPAGVAALALRTGARVLPGGVVRLSDSLFLGFIEEKIVFQPSGHWQQDLQELTQRIVSALERWVRRYPDQWYVFRPLPWLDEEVQPLPVGVRGEVV